MMLEQTVRAIAIALLGLAAMAASPRAALGAQEGPAIIVLSHDSAPYRDAAAGAREVLAADAFPARQSVINDAGGVAPEIAGTLERDAVTIALGQRAGEFIVRSGGRVTVACMAPAIDGRPGVVLPHAAEVRMQWLRKVLPTARAVGVLYADGAGGELPELEAAARRHGLRLVPQLLVLKLPLADQLDRMGDKIDVLLGGYDLRIFSPANAQSLLFFSYRQRIPLIGPSGAWAKAGALFSFDWDYRDLGRQCAESFLRTVRSPAQTRLILERPRRLEYSLNVEAARF
ncbi:MAG: ABC transporter substrate binding protein, partial [Hyphomicrobium sp.]|nr:ABC transporter substrate binding protein [Hyphomicrobium sp.]